MIQCRIERWKSRFVFLILKTSFTRRKKYAKSIFNSLLKLIQWHKRAEWAGQQPWNIDKILVIDFESQLRQVLNSSFTFTQGTYSKMGKYNRRLLNSYFLLAAKHCLTELLSRGQIHVFRGQITKSVILRLMMEKRDDNTK